MVRAIDNALRIEVGFGFSYQWAIDAHNAAVRKADEIRCAVRNRVMATRAAVRQTVKATSVRAHAVPPAVRDRAAAAMLGVPVGSIPQFRQFVMNPVAQAVPQSAAKPKVKAQTAAAAMAIPAVGANIDAGVLRDGLSRVTRAISNASRLPILSHVLIESDGQRLVLRCTDLEVGAKVSIPAGVANRFDSQCVDGKAFLKAVSRAKGVVHIEDDGGNLRVEIGGAATELLTLPAEEFPNFPDVNAVTTETIPNLLSAINTVVTACSSDESKHTLTGVLLTDTRLIASDTHRLHVDDHGGADIGGAFIVPARAMGMLRRAFGAKGDVPVNVSIGDTQAKFTVGDTEVVSRLIEGQFPNFARVIPDESIQTARLTVDSACLRESVLAVAEVAKDDAGRVVIDFSGDVLKLQANASTTGHAESIAPIADKWGHIDGVEQVDGSGMKYGDCIAYCTHYLLDAIRACGDGLIQFGMAGSLGPSKFAPCDDSSKLVVLMPMQIR
jgi:DNA polymerase-3 subunit beta